MPSGLKYANANIGGVRQSVRRWRRWWKGYFRMWRNVFLGDPTHFTDPTKGRLQFVTMNIVVAYSLFWAWMLIRYYFFPLLFNRN